jgi:hypothetical protein
LFSLNNTFKGRITNDLPLTLVYAVIGQFSLELKSPNKHMSQVFLLRCFEAHK